MLIAWHHRHVTAHLEQLTALRDRAGDAGQRLAAVLEGYALIVHERSQQQHGTELTTFLHHDEHVAGPRRQLHELVRDLLADASRGGHVRDGIAPDELATYCLHALGAAGSLPSKTAVRRLVTLTLAGLRPTT